MDCRSPLAKLQFVTLLKCLTHLQELSECILLPDLSLIMSSNSVFLSFCFTLKIKLVATRKLAEMITHLQFILRHLEIEFVSHTSSYSFSLCTFHLRYSPTSIYLLEKSSGKSMEQEYFWDQNIKQTP